MGFTTYGFIRQATFNCPFLPKINKKTFIKSVDLLTPQGYNVIKRSGR